MRIKINREQPFQVLATNFSIGPSSSGYDLQISADGVNFTTLFSVGANVTRMVTGVANGSTYRLQYNTDEDVIVNWERQCNDGGSGGAGAQGPQGEQGPQGYQGAEGAQGPQGQDGIDQDPTLLKSVSELPATADTGDVVSLSVEGTSQVGVYQYDGTNWNAIGGGADGGVVYLDTLSGVIGEENTIYECDSHLWTWNDSGGTCAEWSESIPGTTQTLRGYGLIYSHIPDGQTIIGFRYKTGNRAWRSIKMSGETLVLTEEDGTTIVNSCTYGQDKKFEGSYQGGNYYINVRYQKHYIGFEIMYSIETRDIWNGIVTGGHFEIVDHSNYPYLTQNLEGIPYWNTKGAIIGRKYPIDNRNIYFNSTGGTTYAQFLVTTAGSIPNKIFAPTTGGTAGQVLTSAGNAEPTWETMIKAVKITSDAYEALQDKDPNTLYLIDDE